MPKFIMLLFALLMFACGSSSDQSISTTDEPIATGGSPVVETISTTGGSSAVATTDATGGNPVVSRATTTGGTENISTGGSSAVQQDTLSTGGSASTGGSPPACIVGSQGCSCAPPGQPSCVKGLSCQVISNTCLTVLSGTGGVTSVTQPTGGSSASTGGQPSTGWESQLCNTDGTCNSTGLICQPSDIQSGVTLWTSKCITPGSVIAPNHCMADDECQPTSGNAPRPCCNHTCSQNTTCEAS